MIKQFQALYWIIKKDRPFSDLPDLKGLGKIWGVKEFSTQQGLYADYDSSTIRNEMLEVFLCIFF